ncbi:protein white-like [Glandiceps talaboti]
MWYEMEVPKQGKDTTATTDSTEIPENEQIMLTWTNVTVTTEVTHTDQESRDGMIEMKEMKTILNKVTGLAEPGHFLAIMGSSGAGKTTLLNVLTGRSSPKLKIDGLILANGKPVTDGFKKISAFVQQHDMFLGTMTVREHLMFQANLRMEQGINKKKRIERVEQLIIQVGLSKCADTMIGLPSQHSKCLSGGEQRRLSLASELLTKPSVMFCDEPTSGLDSFMAESVIKSLKDLADRGHTVICTIHQPSSDICAMFDRILIMAAGRCAYLGTLDTSLRFFRFLGYTCPDNFCPTDFFLNILAIRPGSEEDSRNDIRNICDAFEKSSDFLAAKVCVARASFGMTGYKDSGDNDEPPYKASWFTQLSELLKRNIKSIWRNPMLIKVHFISYVVTALFFGVMYFQQENDQKGVQNIQGCVFQFIMLLSATTFVKASKIFPEELPLFYKEHGDRTYTVSAYFLARSYIELPLKIVFPFIEIAIVYWMIGLPKSSAVFLRTSGIAILLVFASHAAGLCVGAISPNVPIAITVANLWFLPCLIVGGFFMNVSTVPIYLTWLYYMSFVPFAYEAISIVIWRDVEYVECDLDSMVPCLSSGLQVISSFGFNEGHLHIDIIILLATFIGYQIIAFLLFWIKTRRIN